MARRRGRVDENQKDIVKGLRTAGVTVSPLSDVGGGVPDLLCGFGGLNYLLEVKNPEKPKADRQLTPVQVEWHQEWRGHAVIVETVEQALDACGIRQVKK